jgi:hypothetical protein
MARIFQRGAAQYVRRFSAVPALRQDHPQTANMSFSPRLVIEAKKGGSGVW